MISVVIPTYNHARFLGEALQSVRNQSYGNWEALIVDNHSQDETEEIVQGFSEPRFRLLKIHNHGVIAASRNLGMRESRGAWIAFLDSDDNWYPKKLETLLAAAGDGASDVISNDEVMIDRGTGERTILRYGPYEPDFYKVLLMEGNRLSPAATMVRRDVISRHGLAFSESTDHITVEDYGFWLDLARIGARFEFVHEVAGEYIIHGANSSTQAARHWQNTEHLLRHHIFDVQDFDQSPEQVWRIVSARTRLWRARDFARSGEWRSALGLGLRTIAASPAGTALYLFNKLKKTCRAVTR